MPEPSLDDLLNVAVDAAYAAGRRTLAYFNTRVAVDLKSDNTPVTCADREAEEMIRGTIQKRFPSHSILGEEGGIHEGSDKRYRWIIDPIDGTKSFICGVPLYGVLIGIEIDGKPQVGVCYLPALDEMVAAATGLGCTWNGRVARVSATSRTTATSDVAAIPSATHLRTCRATPSRTRCRTSPSPSTRVAGTAQKSSRAAPVFRASAWAWARALRLGRERSVATR